MRIWDAPVGFRADLGDLPAGPDGGTVAGLGTVGQVVEIVVRYLTHQATLDGVGGGAADSRSYLESMSWHSFPDSALSDSGFPDSGLPSSDPPAGSAGNGRGRLGLEVVDRTNSTMMLRVHGISPTGDVRLAADLRCRRPAAPSRPSHDGLRLLRVPVRVGDTILRSYRIEPSMLTHHIPHAPGVLMTPSLIALMEDTAADIVRPRLGSGAAAVGTWIGVRHTGVAVLDQQLDVTAVVVRTPDRRITFDVTARVGATRVGEGQVGFTLVSHTPAPAAGPSA